MGAWDDCHNRKPTSASPFLEYATDGVLYHSNAAAEDGGHPQLSFLQDLPLRDWINVHNDIHERNRFSSEPQILGLPYTVFAPSTGFLHLLAANDYAALIKTILSASPAAAIRSEHYQSPLLAALACDHQDAIRALLGYGTTFLREDEIAELLTLYSGKLGNKLGSGTFMGETALGWACRVGEKRLIKVLLARAVGIDAKDIHGSTPLSWASYHGDLDTMQLLLHHGANIKAHDNNGCTMLLRATMDGQLDAIIFLLRKGADINAANHRGLTPLIWAIETVNKPLVRFLLSCGASAATRDDFGWTPLFVAAEVGHVGIVKLLLEHGADPDAKDDRGHTALSWTLAKEYSADPYYHDIIHTLSPPGWRWWLWLVNCGLNKVPRLAVLSNRN